MSATTLGLFLRHLALSEEVVHLGGASDLDLLTAYDLGLRQAVFTELMRRHGPMVLRTCRRILGHGPDAEDAFQATFVLLADHAGSLRNESSRQLSLGAWLHRVAYRTAVNVLERSTRRRTREQRASALGHPQPNSDPATEATWNEIRPILDAELEALPDEARRILIACYLQEKKHAEVAAELGIALGSVAWRLDTARALLAKRLAKRGIVLSAALLALLLEKAANGAGLPAVLLVHGVEAAVRFSERSKGAMSESVAQLVQIGLAEMGKGWTNRNLWLAGWVGLLGAGLIACQTLMAEPDKKSELGPSAPLSAEELKPEESKAALTDRMGDPLPPGALARMGTIRLRSAHGGGRRSLLFTGDGQGIVTAGGGNPIRLWNFQTGKLVREFGEGDRHEFQPTAISPDGRILAAADGTSGRIRFWEAATGKLLAEGKATGADLACLAFSPDGKRVASSGNDAKIRVWDVATGHEQWVQRSAAGAVFAVAFTQDGKSLAAVETKTVSFWDAATGERESGHWSKEQVQTPASFSPDGRILAIVRNLRQGNEVASAVSLVDLNSRNEVRRIAPEKGNQSILDPFQALAVAPGGKTLATANGSGEIRLWHAETGKELCRCQGDRNFVSALAFSSDGKMLAGLDRGVVRVWETTSGKEISTSPVGHKNRVSSIDFSPDEGSLVSNGWDGSARVWDSATGAELRHISPVNDLGDFVLGGEVCAAAKDGDTLTLVDFAWCIKPKPNSDPFGILVRLLDRKTGREKDRFFHGAGNRPPRSLALSPGGDVVAFVSDDDRTEQVQLFESATGRLLFKVPGTLPAFSADGRLLAVVRGGRDDQVLSIRDATTAKELCSAPAAKGTVWYRLGFSPTGDTVVAISSRGANSTIQLWPLLREDSAKDGAIPRMGPVRTLAEGLTYRVEALVFSPDGRNLALPDGNGAVRLLETATGSERACFSGHIGKVHCLLFSRDGRRLVSGSSDTTILVWDLTGRLQDGRLRPARLSVKECEELWSDLGNADAARAERGIWTLIADPAQTAPFLALKLKSASAMIAPESIAKLIRDLDDNAFAVRTKARRELEKLGATAEAALRQAREKSPSFEVRTSLDALLKAVEAQKKNPSGELLRGLRAIEALEQIGNLEARQALKSLMDGSPNSLLTREAQAAMGRLERARRP